MIRNTATQHHQSGHSWHVRVLRFLFVFREKNHADIDSWFKFLEDDKRAIFGAVAHGQPAVDYLCQLQDVDRVAA